MKKYLLVYVLLTTLFTASVSINSTAGTPEAERFKEAERYFLEKQYEKALPLFAQLVSNSPKNFKYNYYYGICILIQGPDKSKALPYLEVALSSSKTPEDIYYYVGRALHHIYRFDEAREYLAEFSDIVGPAEASNWNTPLLIDMCNQAKKQLDYSKSTNVKSKAESGPSDYFHNYQFADSQGKLLVMPDELVGKSKSQGEDRPTIFLSANGRVMYYSAFSNETASRDIFRVVKDRKGNWGSPVRLDRTVNSTYDEVNPTCNYDGRIVYFSSKGHGSTGGFDIFKTVYSPMKNTWKKASNLGSPVNSPDDDFSFVNSPSEKIAYFTSERETSPGTLMVYQTDWKSNDALPIALYGRVLTKDKTEAKSARIQVINTATNDIAAELTTGSIDGSYCLELNQPGTYALKVEAEGYAPLQLEMQVAARMDGEYIDDIVLGTTPSGVFALRQQQQEVTSPAQHTNETASSVYTGEINKAEIQAETGKSATRFDEKPSTPSARKQKPVEFRVQIGAFRVFCKELVRSRLEKTAEGSMLSCDRDNTWLRFYFGSEGSYESAKNLKSTLIQAGFKDAFIAAFVEEKSVDVKSALEMNGEIAEIEAD